MVPGGRGTPQECGDLPPLHGVGKPGVPWGCTHSVWFVPLVPFIFLNEFLDVICLIAFF